MGVSLDRVSQLAAALPEVTEGERGGGRTWSFGGKVFAWERGFSKADLKRFGDEPPPDGPILAVRVDGLEIKEAVLAGGRPGYFTIPHFDGYAAVLIQLKATTRSVVEEALIDGWSAVAPTRARTAVASPARSPSTPAPPARPRGRRGATSA
ncbi:MAG TPA: hypothetical protein VM933_09215 [Acidimicrobiales bacterium]|nr:hypothetical protein [Acidimicrobiales bacterium]